MNNCGQTSRCKNCLHCHMHIHTSGRSGYITTEMFHCCIQTGWCKKGIKCLQAHAQAIKHFDETDNELCMDLIMFSGINMCASRFTHSCMHAYIHHTHTQVLFPMMCFDESDEELWTDDPQEFIRKTYDIMEDYTSPRVAGWEREHILLCKSLNRSFMYVCAMEKHTSLRVASQKPHLLMDFSYICMYT
jgi:hypothetical protein